jgi:hypothetical protein
MYSPAEMVNEMSRRAYTSLPRMRYTRSRFSATINGRLMKGREGNARWEFERLTIPIGRVMHAYLVPAPYRFSMGGLLNS